MTGPGGDGLLVALLVAAVLGGAGGVWATLRVQRWAVAERWQARKGRPRDVARPNARGKGWGRTALYRWRGDGGVGPRDLLYAGISSSPQDRTDQHVADPEKADMIARAYGAPDVTWYPDRYQALAAEHALIDELRPPFNRAPSGSCDAWTDPRPPIVPGKVRLRAVPRLWGMVGR